MTDHEAAPEAQADERRSVTYDGIAPPLVAALAARGYATLTPVQEAVLAPEATGRDLLVSAQTGSGKTVAFGLAIAPELLAPLPPPAPPVEDGEGAGDGGAAAPDLSRLPRALIVAPTRELALQVRREFEWLYAETGLAVASCVGGMDWRTERRALERGPAIVVGTPGRLRDHIERGTLNLAALRSVVLDEADEMLDLGFAEDLAFILAAAPAGRRTLMFSATVPKAIEALAATYQKDALRVIARGEAKQHVDIAYRALSVGPRDKENAVLNLLRLMEPKVAIVFAKTRAGVTHLMARMANRGLSVVALSGELSQTERTHALQALRDGRARVCVATDVAARGIDLPGLELVVHFDLPTNSETLLHRSGRTGRAGAKGQAVLIVAPSEYRKAQRLLAGAKVNAEWGKPPSADEVQAADDERLMAHEALSIPVADEERAMVARLASFGDEALAAAVLRLWRAGRAAPEELHEAPAPAEAPAPVRERAEFGPSVWYELSAGHDRRVEARWLLPRLCDAGGITRLSIGAIRVQSDRSFIQVAEAAAARLEAGLGADLALENGLTLTRLAGEPDLTARFAGPPRPRRADEGEARPRPEARPRRDAGADRPAAAARYRRSDATEGDRPARPRPVDRSPDRPADQAGGPPRYRPAAVGDRPARPRPTDRPEGPKRLPRFDGADRPARPRGDDRDGATAAGRPRKPDAPRPAVAEAPRPPRAAPAGDVPRRPFAPRDPGAGPRKATSGAYDRARKPTAPRGDAAGEDRPRRPAAPGTTAPDGAPPAEGSAPRKARWAPDDPRRAERAAATDAPRARKPATRAAKAPPPDMSDPSQSLRKRPRAPFKPGGAKGAPTGRGFRTGGPKGGPRRGPRGG